MPTQREQAIERLREWLKPGDTLYTIVEHVSASGMTRHIRCVILKPGDNGAIIDLHPNHAVSQATGLRLTTKRAHDAIIMSGCGMDMGFHLVSIVSRVLYGDDYAIKHRWL